MEENNLENKQHNTNSQKPIVGAIIIAGALIAGAILLRGTAPQPINPTNDPNDRSATMNVKKVSADEHVLGNIDAPVVIVEYSDTECPFCKSFHNTMHEVISQNDNKVSWVFRHYPIPSLHPKAFYEAEATECAWEQGGNNAFWQYIDEVFKRTESNNKLEVSELPKIAQAIGLDVAKFNSCLDSGKYKDKIQASIDEKNKSGQIGTPFNVIMTKKDITTKMRSDIESAIGSPGAVSFSSNNKKVMSMNGALPTDMVNKILGILLK
ncbi:MAG: thioredoxin domain-containing protein [Candidatus Paceibacterota bacterium]